nr:MAG TPA: hypothetical protein [Bacteriophage sp.]
MLECISALEYTFCSCPHSIRKSHYLKRYGTFQSGNLTRRKGCSLNA